MDQVELERLFGKELESLSDVSDDEDESGFMIKSIDKMAIIVKSKQDPGDLFKEDDIDDEWKELMFSANVTTDRLNIIQTSVKETREESMVLFNKKEAFNNGDDRLLVNSLILQSNCSGNQGNHPSSPRPALINNAISAESDDDRVYRRQEIKELLDNMIESIEFSINMFEADNKNKHHRLSFSEFKSIPITPSNDLFDLKLIGDEYNTTEETANQMVSQLSTDINTRPNTVQNHIQWGINIDKILIDEEMRQKEVKVKYKYVSFTHEFTHTYQKYSYPYLYSSSISIFILDELIHSE